MKRARPTLAVKEKTKVTTPPPEFNPDYVRSISVEVYKQRLGPDDTERMLKKDGDGGVKLRERAISYDSMTRDYLRAIKAVG